MWHGSFLVGLLLILASASASGMIRPCNLLGLDLDPSVLSEVVKDVRLVGCTEMPCAYKKGSLAQVQIDLEPDRVRKTPLHSTPLHSTTNVSFHFFPRPQEIVSLAAFGRATVGLFTTAWHLVPFSDNCQLSVVDEAGGGAACPPLRPGKRVTYLAFTPIPLDLPSVQARVDFRLVDVERQQNQEHLVCFSFDAQITE